MPTEFMEVDDSAVAEGGIAEGTTQDYDRVWDNLAVACEAQSNISVLVVDAGKGGLTVDLGVRGFIPKSQIGTRNLNGLERYIGQTIDVKVVEVDREKGRVVLSERKAVEEQRAAKRAETMSQLSQGLILDGVVRSLTDFGAFVDIGGVDGLLHVSDIAWEQVDKPADRLQIGQEVRVKILKIENGGKRLSLGMKQLEDDPWTIARREFREGQVIEVTITRIASFGAFAKLRDGVEGLIPVKELSERRVENPESAVHVGQTVTVKILEWPPRERKMTMSIRAAIRDGERQVIREYMHKQREETAPPTLGDLFGDVFSKLKKD